MEIGSEFQYECDKKGMGIKFPSGVQDYTFTFCGRTAIETIINNEHHIKKVMMPSYCCASMLDPFQKAGINICFYPVEYHEMLQIMVDIPEDVDCLYWCNYFGFNIKMPNMQEFINRGGIVIEDITHSLFSRDIYNKQSCYLVASIRKWVPILYGGYCSSLRKKLINKPKKKPEYKILTIKEEAMIEKKEYLEGKNFSKELFLEKYRCCNEWLSQNYMDCMIDTKSYSIIKHVDQEKHISQRKKNASILYEGLKNNPDMTMIFDISDMECPLFVPVFVLNGKRDFFRKKLIENDIYCPVHWPKPLESCKSNLYEAELSLVCDQRYDEEDMRRIIDVLNTDRKERK